MNATKKWVGMAVALTMVTTIAACSSNGSTKESASPGSVASEAPKVPVKISILTTDRNQPVPGGNSMDDPTIKYLAEKTNSILDVTFLPHGQHENLRKVKFASGELTDVVQSWGVESTLLDNDQLVPLDEYLDKYGPNLKKVIPKAAWDAMTRNGKIYAIPESVIGDDPVSRQIFIRKDWMDKVGIKEMPKTPDELLTLLRAFRDQDPNGNGKKDEIPLSARENFTWLDSIVSMFGTNLWGGELLNGEVIPTSISPAMRNAVAFIKQLYDEKLIDSEFMTNKRNTWEQKIQNDQVGMWVHAPDLSWDWQDKLNKALPGKTPVVAAMLSPKAPGVKAAGFTINPYAKTFSITKKAKDPAAVVKLFDWLVTQEGQEFVNFGVPGITFTKDNGKITYNKQKDTDDKSITWRTEIFNLAGWNPELRKIQLGEQAVAKMEEFFAVGRKEGIINPMMGAPSFKSTQPEIGEFGTPGTMFVETAAQIVMGAKPIEYFDEYVKNWRTRGGNDLIKQATEWYNANKK